MKNKSENEQPEYFGNRANSFLSINRLAPYIKVGHSFDKLDKIYNVSPAKRTIENHRLGKALSILNKLNQYQLESGGTFKNPNLWRFHNPELHNYESEKIPEQIKEYFSIAHPYKNIKKINVGEQTYNSPYTSMSSNLRGLVNTDIGGELGRDPYIRNYVFDRSPALSAFQIPERTEGSFFSKPKQNYIDIGMTNKDPESIPIKEAEVLYDTSKPLQEWKSKDYQNPLQNNLEPALQWWKTQASKNDYYKDYQEKHDDVFSNYEQGLIEIPQKEVLSQEQKEKYRDLRVERDHLHNNFYNLASENQQLYSAKNKVPSFNDLSALQQHNKSQQKLKSGGRVRKNDISLTPEEARIAEIFNMSPEEYKKLQNARFKNQGNQRYG